MKIYNSVNINDYGWLLLQAALQYILVASYDVCCDFDVVVKRKF
jgi:hypothetical protein